MRKFSRVFISFVTIFIFVITSSMATFADMQTPIIKLSKSMSNEELIDVADEYGKLRSNGVIVEKLSTSEKQNYVNLNKDDDFDKVDVYTIERQIGIDLIEQTVVAEVDVTNLEGDNRSSTQIIEDKEGRVSVQSVIGYESRTFAGVKHYAGTHYGGRVTSQQSGTAVTSIYGTYAEYGPCYDKSGNPSMEKTYRKTTNFDLSKHTKLQTASISTGKYYNLYTEGAAGISAAYTATYTARGNDLYTITVTAYAKD